MHYIFITVRGMQSDMLTAEYLTDLYSKNSDGRIACSSLHFTSLTSLVHETDGDAIVSAVDGRPIAHEVKKSFIQCQLKFK